VLVNHPLISWSRILLTLVVLALGGVAPAQRGWGGAAFVDRIGTVFIHEGDTTSAEWQRRHAGVIHVGHVTLPSPESAYASLVSPNTMLVSGNTWLCEVRFSVTNGVVTAAVAQVASSSMDFFNFAYSETAGMLFAIDGVSRSLVAATYQPGASPGAWQVVATSAQCPALLHADVLRLHAMDQVAGVAMGAIEPYERIAYRFTQGASGWIMTNVSVGAAPAVLPPTWMVGAYPIMSADGSEYRIWVGGGGAGPFFVVDSNRVPVFAAVHSGAADGETFGIPFASLTYGREYRVIDGAAQGLQDSVPFLAKVVWGTASVPAEAMPERLGFRWDFPAIGTDSISWQLHWTAAGPQPLQPWILTMAIGPWAYNSCPTVSVGGVSMLGAVYGDLGAQMASWQDGKLVFSWTLAVNDPLFIGLRVAAQGIGVLPDGQFFVSDVAGVVLH
jgi:hypothetical protein